MSSISAVLITFNAEQHLENCLASLRDFADEIIIVDNGSSDKTANIARQYTEHFYQTNDWPGFGIQKQRALDKATGDWVLSIDSDEVLTDPLKKEMLDKINSSTFDAYKVPRLNHFLNHPVRFGGCQKDAPVRLFKRENGRFSKDLVHERLLINGRTGELHTKMLHFTVDKIEDALHKMDKYS
jgi:glycosyltransferase involved in cell wall biosynthesis